MHSTLLLIYHCYTTIKEKTQTLAHFRLGGSGSVWIFFIMGILFLNACAMQSKTQMFRNAEHEKVYRAGAKAGKSIIKLNESQQNLEYYRYRISVGDELRIRFLNLPPELAKGAHEIQVDTRYLVTTEGYVAIPLIGKIYVRGKTVEEIQRKLILEYTAYYPNPVIDVNVTNLKVFIFGEGRQGVVILPNEKTHLIEALALAGGIPNSAKPHKVKIIRGTLNNPEVIWVNTRDISVLSAQELYMQAGDIIYLEPRNLQLFIREVAPYTTVINLVTLVPTFYILLRNLGAI